MIMKAIPNMPLRHTSATASTLIFSFSEEDIVLYPAIRKYIFPYFTNAPNTIKRIAVPIIIFDFERVSLSKYNKLSDVRKAQLMETLSGVQVTELKRSEEHTSELQSREKL